MKIVRPVIGTAWHEVLCREAFNDELMMLESVTSAERRATRVFDMLLTYLSGDEQTMPLEARSKD